MMVVTKKKIDPPKPEKLSGAQKDALQKLRDKKQTSVPQQLADGKIDPGKAMLNPEDFDKFDAEYRSHGAEGMRIKAIIVEHLNENFPGSKEEPYTWDIGLFLEKDPRSQGAKGFKVLQVEMLGTWWSTQLQHEAGLDNFEGAVTWNGRGTFERHIICVKTKQLRRRQQSAKTARLKEQMQQQPQSVAGERVRPVEVKETHTKLPVIPVEGKNPVEGGAAESTTD